MVAEESFSWNPDLASSTRTRLLDILKAERDEDTTGGAPRFAPAGDRPLVGTAAGLAGEPENSTPFRMPPWSEERLRELGDAEPGGLMACSPELMAEFKEMAKTDPAVAATLERAGVKADDPANCPDCQEAKRHAYSDATTPGFFYTECERHRKREGKTTVDPATRRQILDELAGAEMQDGLYNNGADVTVPEPEVEICGHREHIWETGEWVMCTLPKDHRKGRHGKPVKVEGPE